MRVKDIIAEDFLNYKHPAMFIASSICDWKCCRESGIDDICQNKVMAHSPTTDISDEVIYEKFHSNDITKAVVVGGLEPMLQIDEVVSLIKTFRSHGEGCTFVIYTGYNPEEIPDQITKLIRFQNIIIKFGRFIPNRQPKYDDVLGITLASNNQFAMEIC